MQTEYDITGTGQIGANRADPGVLRNPATTVYGEEMSSLGGVNSSNPSVSLAEV